MNKFLLSKIGLSHFRLFYPNAYAAHKLDPVSVNPG